MKKTKKLVAAILSTAMFAGVLAGCGGNTGSSTGGEDDADKTFTFTVAARSPEGDLTVDSVTWFANEIESRSEGRIKLDIQYNGVLCSQGTEFEALESGICDIAVASLSSSADRWPSLGWVIVPGAVSTFTQQQAALHAVQDAGYVDNDMANNDVRVLWWQPAESFNYALTDKKVESLADFKGLKIGYAGGAYIGNAISATGATAVGTNAADFYMSLSTGVLNGFVNPARYMYDAQFYEVVKYMPVGITCGGSNNSVYMSNSAFDSMPEDLQEIFLEVCAEAEEHFIQNATELYADEYELLTENGCECYELSDNVIEEYNQLCADLGNDWVAEQEAAGNTDAAAILSLVQETVASVE